MQPSGDRYTWLMNSARNLAVTGASLNFPALTPIVISGDDSSVCGRFGPNPSFRPRAWRISPKRIIARVTEFCGWSFGAPELHVSLAGLNHRVRVAIQRGVTTHDFWRSMAEMVPLVEPDDFALGALQHMFRTVTTTLCRSFVSPLG